MIAFEVPGEPVAFARARVNPQGARFTPKKQATYHGAVRLVAAARMGATAPMEGPLRLAVRAEYLYPLSWSQKRRDAIRWKTSKPDADNIIKLCADAMNGIVYRDDAQLVEVTLQKVYSADRTCLVVEVSPAEDAR